MNEKQRLKLLDILTDACPRTHIRVLKTMCFHNGAPVDIDGKEYNEDYVELLKKKLEDVGSLRESQFISLGIHLPFNEIPLYMGSNSNYVLNPIFKFRLEVGE